MTAPAASATVPTAIRIQSMAVWAWESSFMYTFEMIALVHSPALAPTQDRGIQAVR